MRAIYSSLALPLLVLRILADDPDDTVPADDLTLLTTAFD
jgi:hypothetical protein